MTERVHRLEKVQAVYNTVKSIKKSIKVCHENDDLKSGEMPQLFEKEGILYEIPRVSKYVLNRLSPAEMMARGLMVEKNITYNEVKFSKIN